MGTGAEMRSVIVSEHAPVAGQTLVNFFFPVPSDSPRGLCESQLVPDSLSFLKWQMALVTSPLGFSAFR